MSFLGMSVLLEYKIHHWDNEVHIPLDKALSEGMMRNRIEPPTRKR